MQNGILRETRQFRGITLEQAVRYLQNLGGDRVSPTDVRGTDWRARLSSTVLPVGPSYRLTTITVSWEGKPKTLEPVIYGFRLKAFRAPG